MPIDPNQVQWDLDPAQVQWDEAPKAEKPLEWGDVPLEALKNIPSSAGQFAKNIYQTVSSPVETAGTLANLFTGTVQSALPEWLQAESARPQRELAGNVGQFFKERYGSEEGIKKTIATDPVGALADVSAVLTGGGGLLAKAPGLAKAGQVAQTAGRAVNPLSIAGKAAAPAGRLGGKALSDIIGGIGTHTGGESIRQAARAGFKGGVTGDKFRANLRGNVPVMDVLDDAKANLMQMKIAKNNQYRSGMMDITKDKSVLSFKGIDDAVKSAKESVSFKDVVKSPEASKYLNSITKEVDRWKKLDPKQYHTPEGIDALKQRISDISESIPLEQRNARRVVSGVTNAIKKEISKQAPVYDDVMRNYSRATDEISEIEKTLSLGKAAPDTALRKLQSVMRNNVNANYGRRGELAGILESQGREIMPSLAGQALSSPIPRGLGQLQAGVTGLSAMANPAALALLPFQSPRLMGEAAYYAGKAAKPISGLGALTPYGPYAAELGQLGLLE